MNQFVVSLAHTIAWLSACNGSASVRIESDNTYPMIHQENTSVTNAVDTNPFLGAYISNVRHPQPIGAKGP